MRLRVPDEVMRPLVPVLRREDLRSDGAKRAHDLAMQPAMPRDHVSSRPLMPLLVNPAVFLMHGPTGGPHLVRSARDRLHLPLLPEQDVRERVLVGPVLARPPGALSETRHRTVEPAARQPAHRPVEGVVFRLHAAYDATARMPDRRHGTLTESLCSLRSTRKAQPSSLALMISTRFSSSCKAAMPSSKAIPDERPFAISVSSDASSENHRRPRRASCPWCSGRGARDRSLK